MKFILDIILRMLIMLLPIIGFQNDMATTEWYGTAVNLCFLGIASFLIGIYGKYYNKFFKD